MNYCYLQTCIACDNYIYTRMTLQFPQKDAKLVEVEVRTVRSFVGRDIEYVTSFVLRILRRM